MNRRFEAYCSPCCSLDWGLRNTSKMSQALAEKPLFQGWGLETLFDFT